LLHKRGLHIGKFCRTTGKNSASTKRGILQQSRMEILLKSTGEFCSTVKGNSAAIYRDTIQYRDILQNSTGEFCSIV
jgi:hypothetical protein